MTLIKYDNKYFTEVCNLFYNTIDFINKKDYNLEQLNKWAPLNNDYQSLCRKLNNSDAFLIVEDNVVVGFGNIKDNYLDLLYIHHEYNNLGYGSILLEKLEEFATDDITVHASITAVNFFKKHQYLIIRENTVLIENVELINYLMIKTKK